MFKFKLLAASLAMLATQSVFANTYDNIDLGPPGSYTKVITHTANDNADGWTFSDTFNFTINSKADTSGDALDSFYDLKVGSHINTAGIDTFRVQLFSSTGDQLFEFFNTPYDDTKTPLGAGYFSFGHLAAGSYKMVVTGQLVYTNPATNEAAAGTYSVNLNATAVPEADAYAMMLAGLGLVGFAARRKISA